MTTFRCDLAIATERELAHRIDRVMLLFLVGLPLLLVWVMARLPRLTGGKGQIPDHEYWFADERKDATESFLLAHSCWLGSLTAAIIFGIHISIQRANALSMLEYDVVAKRIDAHGSSARCKDAEIVLDTDVNGRPDAFNLLPPA